TAPLLQRRPANRAGLLPSHFESQPDSGGQLNLAPMEQARPLHTRRGVLAWVVFSRYNTRMAIELPSRRPHYRLAGYDYAQAGVYFVTICVRDRACLFGRVQGDTVGLTKIGEVVDAAWREIPSTMQGAALDLHVVMPNHLHGLV